MQYPLYAPCGDWLRSWLRSLLSTVVEIHLCAIMHAYSKPAFTSIAVSYERQKPALGTWRAAALVCTWRWCCCGQRGPSRHTGSQPRTPAGAPRTGPGTRPRRPGSPRPGARTCPGPRPCTEASPSPCTPGGQIQGVGDGPWFRLGRPWHDEPSRKLH